MSTVTVSSKFQVVIPKEIRERSRIEAGAVLEVISYGSRIELVPIVHIRNLKGRFKNLDTSIVRDDEEQFI